MRRKGTKWPQREIGQRKWLKNYRRMLLHVTKNSIETLRTAASAYAVVCGRNYREEQEHRKAKKQVHEAIANLHWQLQKQSSLDDMGVVIQDKDAYNPHGLSEEEKQRLVGASDFRDLRLAPYLWG